MNNLKTKKSNSPNSSPSRWNTLWMYGMMSAIGLLMLFPLLWLLSTSLKSSSENIFQFPPQLLPQQPTLENFIKVWQTSPFGRYLFNSSLIAGLTVSINVLFCALAAYPLARLNFRGREAILIAIVSTIMIPSKS